VTANCVAGLFEPLVKDIVFTRVPGGECIAPWANMIDGSGRCSARQSMSSYNGSPFTQAVVLPWRSMR
jgi:hypothetical protein